MSVRSDDIALGMIGARAALETFSELLTEFAAEHGVDADAVYFSLNDVVRLVGVARASIEGGEAL